MHQGENKVFIEEEAEKLAHAIVSPAAMDQEKTLKVVELGEGKVTVEHGLHPLQATDADSNVGSCKETPEVSQPRRLFPGLLP